MCSRLNSVRLPAFNYLIDANLVTTRYISHQNTRFTHHAVVHRRCPVSLPRPAPPTPAHRRAPPADPLAAPALDSAPRSSTRTPTDSTHAVSSKTAAAQLAVRPTRPHQHGCQNLHALDAAAWFATPVVPGRFSASFERRP